MAVAGWLIAFSAVAMCGDRSAPGLDAETRTQEQIDRTVMAVVKQDPAVEQRFEELQALSGGDRRSLLLQMALYLRRSDSTEESMGGAIVLHRLEFTPAEKLDAILPYLEDSEPQLRKVFTDLLGTIDRPDGGEPDFSTYESRLERDGQPPRALILYMVEVSPVAALNSLIRIYGDRGEGPGRSEGRVRDLEEILDGHEASLTWTEEDRDRARAILEHLSRDPAWWVRLYAAGTMNRYDALASPGITERLKADPHAIVRKAAGP
jgi:hypothetical protein